MGTTMYPKNAGNGYFGNMGKPFMYMPDKYVEQLPYAKTQPYDTRKLGFGTHDASKRDEFTDRVRTARHGDLLKREKSILQRNEQKRGGLAEQIRKAHSKPAGSRCRGGTPARSVWSPVRRPSSTTLGALEKRSSTPKPRRTASTTPTRPASARCAAAATAPCPVTSAMAPGTSSKRKARPAARTRWRPSTPSRTSVRTSSRRRHRARACHSTWPVRLRLKRRAVPRVHPSCSPRATGSGWTRTG